MPRRRGVVIGFVVVMASLAGTPPVPAAADEPGSAHAFSGISSRLQSTAPTPITPSTGEHAAHPALASVSVMAPWRSLEPQDQVFDWTQMNASVDDAQGNGYDIILRVMAGRMVPGWLIDPSVPGTARTVRMLGTDQNASDYCNWIDVPVPWDPVLRAEYVELMREIGRWLNEGDGTGGRKADHVRLVPISMPSALGTEMVLGYGGNVTCPDGKDGASLNLAATNRAAWDAVGTEADRRASTENAWRDAIAIHMQELPADVPSVIAYGAVFGDAQAAALRIASSEVAKYPGRLWSMYTNLQPQIRSDGTLGPWRNWCPKCHEVISAAIGSGGEVGFQTAAGTPNSTLARYSTAADDALATYGMRFLETQPANIDKYQSYLLTGEDPLQDRIRDGLLPPPPPEPHATSTLVACDEATAGVARSCTATVTDVAADPSTPSGTVTWTTTNGTVTASCTLDAAASCEVELTPASAGTAAIATNYTGTATHLASHDDLTVDVARRGTTTTVACGGPVTLPSSATCTATVTDSSGGTTSPPAGTITWSTTATGTFSTSSCVLAALPASSTASACSTSYAPSVSGSHQIYASFGGGRTHDPSAGTTTVTAQSPSAQDTVAPTVQITSPANGATVRRNAKITIAAAASDDIGVTRVVFSVNAQVKCTDTVAPWSCVWTVKAAKGPARLTATAFDAAGNSASHVIGVTIR